MDLWDVVRLMARRWYVSVPMLALTVAALVWTGLTVSPNHTAEAHVMVLPPTTYTSVEPGEDQVVNPWTTDSLAGALVTTLRNRNLADQLEEEGYRAEWEVGLDIQFLSVIRLEVTSPTEHEAQEAVSRLLQAVANEVEARQAPYEIGEGEKVTAIVLGAGENTDVVRGNQVRAMVVVFAAFLILTMGVTIGVDAMARRRRARGVARVAPAHEPGRVPSREPGAHPTAPSSPAPSSHAPSSPAPAYATGNGRHEPADPGMAGATSVVAAEHQAERTSQPGIKVSYRPPPARASASVPGAGPGDGAGTSPPEDATVVLPLSGTDLRRRDGRDKRHDSSDEPGSPPRTYPL